jgi:hypothetical protein
MYTKYFSIFSCCGGAYGDTPYTVMLVHVRVDFEENWGMAEPEQCCKVMVEATNPQRLHPTSKSYVYKVCYNLDMLWMGIWVRPYTVMPVQVGSGI